jgi:hypothetical protein
MEQVSSRRQLDVKHVNPVLLHLKYLDIEPFMPYDTGHTDLGKAVGAMLWSNKAFEIYMGDAGNDSLVDAAEQAEAFDVRNRTSVRAIDPCSDGNARSGWLSRSGTSLTDTQLHSAVRG